LATTLDVSVRKMQDESSLPDILVLLPCKQVKKEKNNKNGLRLGDPSQSPTPLKTPFIS
jgi:hypothetical protein